MTDGMQVEQINTRDIKPYPRNARTHTDDQIGQIAASIREFGFVNPILLDDRGTIIAGHGRYDAALRLQLEAVPAIRLPHLSQEQVGALRIADNRIALNAGWDDELLREALAEIDESSLDIELLGFTDSELDTLLHPAQQERREDKVVELGPSLSEPGDIWTLGDHRLMCGDSTDPLQVRELMKSERAILFATDPPYGVGYEGGNRPKAGLNWGKNYGNTWDDHSEASIAQLLAGFMDTAMAEAIEDNAAWYCWYASTMHRVLADAWEARNILHHQTIIWAKNRGTMTHAHYQWKHEACSFGWIQGNRPPRNAGAEVGFTVWQLDVPLWSRSHPTVKPTEVFGIPMRQHVPRGGLCYEPFSGSGSQIIAGEIADRRVYAMEIEPPYIDVAIKRWQQETGRKAVDQHGKTYEERECQI